ncbi:hypothetical protein FHR87_002922 [Azomonas macrocytogenes]|uniref:Uncharacterized protein n=1 Tax=Azomonas macrocytogenes TaxID=69962 RepID=A0A839T4Y2_AZOMA|nr:hypothetical protein [Azomonas macrocytogenes]
MIIKEHWRLKRLGLDTQFVSLCTQFLLSID